MANFGWVIDQTSCIGCHACTTACKSENEVPLGVNRTWVKYVETGTFPATRRQIAVMRCNHCAEPPCVEVCPTAAMFQRPDGIVDFDTQRCIGCKACLQACPYDAIYIDPDEHVAEKCNFCAHRVDRGLLPACVVVCPTESLVFGDLDDPRSRASQLVSSRPTTVRRPEQGTRPKAFYLGASDAVLDPLAGVHGGQYMWAERRRGGSKDFTADLAGWGSTVGEVDLVAMTRSAGLGGAGGTPWTGAAGGGVFPATAALPSPTYGARRPLPVLPFGASGAAPRSPTGGPAVRRAELRMPKARVAYDVFHPRPWGWKVALYLWTKGIAAGAFAVMFVAGALGLAATTEAQRLAAAFLSLLFVGLTALLLVWDLKRPERFWTILVRPQLRSWLAIGSFVLLGYSGLLGLWFLGSLARVDATWLSVVGWPAAALAAMAALYSAFLLGQCEARDLWQNPVVGIVLLAQATILGASALALVAAATGSPADLVGFARGALLAGSLANAMALLLGEAVAEHPTTNARAAARLLVRGVYRSNFWVGGVLLAGLVPAAAAVASGVLGQAALAGAAGGWWTAATGAVAAAGLLWYELGFVAAAQAVPIS